MIKKEQLQKNAGAIRSSVIHGTGGAATGAIIGALAHYFTRNKEKNKNLTDSEKRERLWKNVGTGATLLGGIGTLRGISRGLDNRLENNRSYMTDNFRKGVNAFKEDLKHRNN